jgi:hypothetical protein
MTKARFGACCGFPWWQRPSASPRRLTRFELREDGRRAPKRPRGSRHRGSTAVAAPASSTGRPAETSGGAGGGSGCSSVGRRRRRFAAMRALSGSSVTFSPPPARSERARRRHEHRDGSSPRSGRRARRPPPRAGALSRATALGRSRCRSADSCARRTGPLRSVRTSLRIENTAVYA